MGGKARALAVRQPWAELIACGAKTIEHRTWRTHYRGPLVICASGRPMTVEGVVLPTQCAVAVVDLVDCRPFTPEDVDAACLDGYRAGWAWALNSARRVDPFPVANQLNLFWVELDATQSCPR